jgi:two-component system phosphate regulon sensor histidine kinase PhoR
MKRRSSFFWKLFISNALLLALGLVTCVWLILAEFNRFHAEEVDEHLRIQAATLREVVEGRLAHEHAAELDRLVKAILSDSATRTRITLILPDGRVLADSHARADTLDNHARRPEVVEALRDGQGTATRWSTTVGRELRYVAVRAGPPDKPEGIVRTALEVRTIINRGESLRRLLWTVALVAVGAAVALALVLARLWIDPIRSITSTARNLSRGDLSARAEVSGNDEISTLALALNRMRDRLAAHVDVIDRQRLTLEALVSQVQDGIIVAGADGRIVLCNPTATRLLHPDAVPASSADSWVGKSVEECVPQHALQKLLLPRGVTEPSEGGEQVQEVRIRLRFRQEPLSLLARAMDIVLPAAGPVGDPRQPNTQAGRILSLTDITQLDRMIQMKTDFVANASHELRTPLAVIRSSIETLRSLDAAQQPDVAARFIDSINRHTRRLEDLVNDLLDLSRVESPLSRFQADSLPVRDLLTDLRERYRDAVEAKKLRWESRYSGTSDETVSANRQLLNLILDNLVSNAIKFTEPGGVITVTSTRDDTYVVFEVADTGIGIPKDEQIRIFERFYQVERSRSGYGRGTGGERGTGLGLAIVRHAAAAMRATVHLESEVGRGTLVSLVLPVRPAPPGDSVAGLEHPSDRRSSPG